jgi:DNA polymerase-4
VGERVLEGLCDFNVRLVGELARIPVRHLVLGFGRLGFTLSRKARGIDPTPVHPPNKRPALKEEEQFPSDTNDYPELVDALYRLVERGGRRLRRSGRVTGKLSLHLRYADYREARGSVRLSTEADLDPVLFDAARPLFDKLLERRIRIRHLALVLENLADAPAQLSLFPSDAPTKAASLVSALDCIRMKYGDSAVVKGSAMRKRPKKQREDAELQSGGERLNAEAKGAETQSGGRKLNAEAQRARHKA